MGGDPVRHRGGAPCGQPRPGLPSAGRPPDRGRMMVKIGYARVSTRSQNDDSQVDDLTAHGCDKIFTDTASGKNAACPDRPSAARPAASPGPAPGRHGGVAVVSELHFLAAENDRARPSAILAWRLDRDLHCGEVVRVDSARHGEGPAPAIWNEECASGRHLAAVSVHVPAPVPGLGIEVFEAVHGQGDIPAAGGILTGRGLPGGCSVADYLGRSGGMERDHDCGLGGGDPASAKAERQDDGGGDDRCGHCDGSGEAASVPSPHRQASDRGPGLRLGGCRWPARRWGELGLGLGQRPELRDRLDPGLGLGRMAGPGNPVDPGR